MLVKVKRNDGAEMTEVRVQGIQKCRPYRKPALRRWQIVKWLPRIGTICARFELAEGLNLKRSGREDLN